LKNHFYLLVFIALAGCKKQPVISNTGPVQPVPEIQFLLTSTTNFGKFTGGEIYLKMTGDSAKGVVPVVSNQKSFVLSFIPATANVKIGDVVQQSGVTVNDFTKPITYTFTNAQGVFRSIKVSVTNFTGIPVFYLTTAGPVVSRDVYITGSLSVNPNGQFDQDTSAIPLTIKGRGNSTWGMPKKPYHIKFNKKAPLLGLPAAKDWVLLANYSDKTLLRNSVALAIGQQFSADFTPHYRFVEVIMNGVYLGDYNLTEQVEVNPGRVNITKMTTSDTSPDAITGGYALELDQHLSDTPYFYTTKNLPITIQSPGAITASQLTYIHNYFQQTEDAIFADNFADPINGYAKYINVDSFIDWYLVKELMKDNDGLGYSSIFYYKDRGGKLGMGPVWDFDLAGGNTDYSDCKNPTGWWIRNAVWFNRLFQDPAFAAKVKARWVTLKPNFPAIFANIDYEAAYIDKSQQQNFQTWPILNTYVWPNAVVLGNYSAEVGYLKNWLQTRIDWMDANM